MKKTNTEEFKTKKNKNKVRKDRRMFREFTRNMRGFDMEDLKEIEDADSESLDHNNN